LGAAFGGVGRLGVALRESRDGHAKVARVGLVNVSDEVSTWTPTPGGFHNAVDLVRYIHKTYPGDFCVAVAGFPQGHA
jgi:hypothetical protein